MPQEMLHVRGELPGVPSASNAARMALAVIVNLEHWDWEVPASTPVAVSPMGGPEGLWGGNQPQFPDIGGYGNHEYGNGVGIFRVLAVLDKYGITPTLALDKAVADHYPALVEEGQCRGAEFIAHGLSRRRIIHIGMSEAATGRMMVLHLQPVDHRPALDSPLEKPGFEPSVPVEASGAQRMRGPV